MSLVISKEVFEQELAPRSKQFKPDFKVDEEIRLVAFHNEEEDKVKWGKNRVGVIELDNGERVPAPKILHNMVLITPDDIYNEGVTVEHEGREQSFECVKFADNTLYDYLLKHKTNENGDPVLPGKITPIKKIKKGVAYENIQTDYRKKLYEQSYYTEDGAKFESLSKFEYIPSIFPSPTTGNPRNNYCFMLDTLD